MADASHEDATDLLYGVRSIADHLGMTEKQVYHMHDRRTLPTFALGRKVCARRSTLARHFAEQEAAARRGATSTAIVGG